jgi:transcriptional regulator
MHIPKHFRIDDQNEALSFIEKNAFGQLVTIVDNKPFATHIPFLLSEDKQHLIAHIAKTNPQHINIEKQEVLVIFTGPHDYISPTWYESNSVPTWNYQAVHVYGKCSVFSDPVKLENAVNSLTHHYEKNRDKP